MIYQVKLSDTTGALDDLELFPENGYVCQRLDLGHPAIRTVNEVRPNQNGSSDYTQFYGARTITLAVGIAHEATVSDTNDTDVLDRLMMFMRPSNRLNFQYMETRKNEWRQAYVRPDQKSNPINLVRDDFLIPVLQFVAPDGVLESAEEVLSFISASTSVEQGRIYDRTFNQTYPASPVIGEKIVINSGTADAIPFVKIYGPCTAPNLINLTQGKGIYFKGTFSLLAGEWLEIDFKSGSVLLNGDPNNPRYSQLDFTTTDWWTLSPGDNRIKFSPSVSSDPSQVIMSHHHTYL